MLLTAAASVSAGSPNTAPAQPGEVSQIMAQDAWGKLAGNSDALLVDVRSRIEWALVGTPDLSELGKRPVLIEWQVFPEMMLNRQFCAELERHLNGRFDVPLYFLCKVGGRSQAAAEAMAARGHSQCSNIVDGFEGNLNAERRRGLIDGWKAAGLPWIQT